MRSNRRRGLALVLGLGLAMIAVAPAIQGSDCQFYANSTPIQDPEYGTVCGSSSPFGCSECTKWTSPSGVLSCVQAGEGDCFEEEHQN